MTICHVCCNDFPNYYFPLRNQKGRCRDCIALRNRILYYEKAGRVVPDRVLIAKRIPRTQKKKIPLPQVTAVPDIDPAQFHQVFQ